MTRIHALALALSLSACSEDGGPPDAHLDTPDAAVVACTADPTTCAGETICVAGQCVPAFGRAYRIGAMSATVPQYDPAGQTWDAGGGLPDPYAVISLNGAVLGTTATVANTLTPTWNMATPPTAIPAGSTVEVDVYDDDDVTADEGIVSCVLSPVTADQLHAGTVTCAGALGTVVVAFVTQ